jgi:hypothetical protein
MLDYAETGMVTDFGFHMPMTYLNPYYDDIVQKYVDKYAKTPQQRKGLPGAKRFASGFYHRYLSSNDVNVVHVREYPLRGKKAKKQNHTIPSHRDTTFCNWAMQTGLAEII